MSRIETGAVPPAPGRARSRWLRGPYAWWLLGAAATAVGVALGWEWLAAAGALPLLLPLLLCVGMCAAGLCMRHGKGGSGPGQLGKRPPQ